MNPLKVAMKAAGLSQGKVAEALGVSGQTVYYWAAGKRPIPPGRVGLLAKVLDIKPDDLASMVTPEESARGLRLSMSGEPKTLFGFCVKSVWAGVGDDFADRCDILAHAAGVTLYDIRDWLDGRAKIPAEVLRAWADGPLGGLNPLVFKWEAEVEDPDAEPGAVLKTVKELRSAPPMSYAEAARRVSQAHMDFLNSEQVTPAALRAALDNGRDIPELLWQKAEEFKR